MSRLIAFFAFPYYGVCAHKRKAVIQKHFQPFYYNLMIGNCQMIFVHYFRLFAFIRLLFVHIAHKNYIILNQFSFTE